MIARGPFFWGFACGLLAGVLVLTALPVALSSLAQLLAR